MAGQKKRISRALIAAIEGVLAGRSHWELNSLFLSAGAPGPIPDASHAHKWRDWIVAAGQHPDVDNLEFVGALIEGFMDIPPLPPPDQSDPSAGNSFEEAQQRYQQARKRLEDTLAVEGLQYFRGGRIIPNGTTPGTYQSERRELGPANIT
jgi:hypothetical protein